MLAADVLERLSACGVRLMREGDALVAIPKEALNDELRALIRAHKPELIQALGNGPDQAEDRRARALAFLDAHPNVKRACFADVKADPANIVLTVAIREPWGAVEVLVRRERFDAPALMELSLRYSGTSLSVPDH